MLGKGSSWDRSPPGSAHSWRKRHFWGQTSAWEKFQGCLWNEAVAELLGPRATAMVLGSGVLVGCSLWAWEGITMICKRAKLQAGCWDSPGGSCGSSPSLKPRLCFSWDTGAGCTPGEPRASVYPSVEPPPGRCWLAVLQEGFVGSVGQCLREAAFPVPHARPCTGKPSHVRPATCQRPPPVSQRVPAGVTATALL